MSRREVPINGAVLTWAREDAGISASEFASLIGTERETLVDWESGAALPTKGEFSKIVETLKRPSAIFFLPEAPSSKGIPISFRSAPGLKGHHPARDEIQQFRWARRLQEIASWLLKDRGIESVALPRFSHNSSTNDAAANLREFLGTSIERQLGWKNSYDALREWRLCLEENSVIVLQLELGRSGVRGFSVWDNVAPVVGLNSSYHPTARIYTLLHELGHLVTRTDSACFGYLSSSNSDPTIERWCEEFAAEFLIPREALLSEIQKINYLHGLIDDVDIARKLAGRFKVSTRAMGLRLQELRLAPANFYALVSNSLEQSEWNPVRTGGSGETAPEKRSRQLGSRLPELLLDASYQGRITSADVSDYLHLSTGQVDDFRRLIGSGY